jgi:ABC-type transporter Mla subunit MlaD
MKDNKTNALIAITTLVAAVLMVLALSFAIGKWSFGQSRYHLLIKFPNASGISANSEVKYAGAKVGRVKEIRLIPRKEQTQDPDTGLYNAVEVVAEINDNVEVGSDVTASIKQDGLGIAAMYILLSPGSDHDSKLLADGSVIQGHMPYDLTSLVQPAGEALDKAKTLIGQLQPIVTRLDSISSKMDTQLPPMIDHADKFLQDGDSVLANLDSPESRERINTVLASLRVASENLKVVSSNAKALTATLAEKPWRVFWGGPTIPPAPEAEVLKSNNVIPLTPSVDVNGTPAKKNATPPSSTAKPIQQIN